MQRVCENANTFRHFACAARSLCEKERQRERGRGKARVPVAGLGANVFTPKRFWVHGDTLVWRPLTVNTYICMCSYLSLSLCLSLSHALHMCEKFHVALFWQNANEAEEENNEGGEV